MTFHWREYIKVDKHFGREERKLLKQVLDDIAATGEDGETLLRTAVENIRKKNPDSKKLVISPRLQKYSQLEPDSGTQLAPEQSTIFMSLDQISRTAFDTPQGKRSMSLTGAMVHELFHAADPFVMFQISDRLAEIDQQREMEESGPDIESTSLNQAQKDQVQKEFAGVIQKKLYAQLTSRGVQDISPDTHYLILEQHWKKALMQEMLQKDQKEILAAVTEQLNLPPGSFTYPVGKTLDIKGKDILATTFTEEQKEKITDAISKIADTRLKSLSRDRNTLRGEDPFVEKTDAQRQIAEKALLQEITTRANVPEGSFTVRPHRLYPESMSESEKASRDVLLEAEEPPTRFTDIFMAKHFPQEPWRGKYANYILLKEQTPLKELRRQAGCGEIREGVYEPQEADIENLGHFAQPKISKNPDPLCSKPQKSKN